MGYLKDQEGIMNRYLREGPGWKTHLDQTRQFIAGSFLDPSIERVAVLGSGWLLDVPLDEMTRRYKRIYLVDIHHPPQIRRKVRDIQNVELVESDLTGGAVEQVWRISRENGIQTSCELVDKIVLHRPLEQIQTDACISLNLLNQLDIILVDFLRKCGYFQHEPPDIFRKMIQEYHIRWITRAPGCLVTDTEEVNLDRNDNESCKPLLFTPLPDGFRKGHWNWEFDSHRTYRPGTRTSMHVEAVEWK